MGQLFAGFEGISTELARYPAEKMVALQCGCVLLENSKSGQRGEEGTRMLNPL